MTDRAGHKTTTKVTSDTTTTTPGAGKSDAMFVAHIGQKDADSERYFGAASVAWLADRGKTEDPTLVAAYSAADKSPLKSQADADNLAHEFYMELQRLDEARVLNPADDRVDQVRLENWAGEALITTPVEVDVGQALSKQQHQDILAFPLGFVPITNRHYHLEMVLDKRRITMKK